MAFRSADEFRRHIEAGVYIDHTLHVTWLKEGCVIRAIGSDPPVP
ncbi:MAG: hypothetical protein V4726_22260 [Verrucomicrobiota bacterium]